MVALVATLSLADPLVVASGLKVTPMVHDAPGASETGQSFACANHDAPGPTRLMAFTAMAPWPRLFSVVVSAPLVVPTTTTPNLRLVVGSNAALGTMALT